MWRSALCLAACVAAAAGSAHAEWKQVHQVPGSGNTWIAIAAGSPTAGAAVGVSSQNGQSKPAIVYTTSGDAWTNTQPPGDFSIIVTLSMPDDKVIYGGGLGMYKSSNGGQSFSEVKLPATGGGPFSFTSVEKVFATDASHAWALSEGNVFWTPNGMQWQLSNPGFTVTYSSLHFLDYKDGWVGGGGKEEITETDPYSGEEKVVGYNYLAQGIVMRTKDGAKTFEPLVVGSPDYFQHLTFVNETIGFAVVSNNSAAFAIKRTTDGGKTWVDAGLPDAPESMSWLWLSKIAVMSPLTLRAAGCVGWPDTEIDNLGNKAVVLISQDGGTSWDYEAEAEGQGCYMDISFPGAHWGFVAGTFGRIVKFDDGTPWEEPPDPDVIAPGDDVTVGPDGSLPQEDVFTWGSVFGTFGDDVLIGASSYPQGGDGGALVVPGSDAGCETETRSTGGCAVGGAAGGNAWAVVIAMVLAVLVMRRRGEATGRPASANRSRFGRCGAAWATAWLLAALASGGCGGGEETVPVCPDAGSVGGFDFAAAADVVAGDTGGSVPWSCGLAPGAPVPDFANAGPRRYDVNDAIVFVRARKEGGSDLFIASPDGKQVQALTRFESPDVTVAHPSWSPDRKWVAFSSTYRWQFNQKRTNLFVVGADGTGCFQLTPGVDLVRPADESDLSAKVTGAFKFGSGAVAAPVAGASAAAAGGTTLATTGSGGEFSLDVAPGTGAVVLRGMVNGMQVEGVAPYEVAAGKTVDLGAIVGSIEAANKIGPIAWGPDGKSLYPFVEDDILYLARVDSATGEMAPYLEKPDDRVVAFAPFPSGNRAVVAYNSAPETYRVVSLDAGNAVLYELTFPGQTAASGVTMSPMQFLASLQGDAVMVLGADAQGEIAVEEVKPGSASGLAPGQLDWSLTGVKLVTVMAAGATTNLVVIDVNKGESVAITTDGTSSMPAWAGR